MVVASASALTFLARFDSFRLSRHNLFDWVRLYAAIQVLMVHGQNHLGWSLPVWFGAFSFLPGVPIFFSISGFLIGLSWLRLSHNWRVYAWNRALRIFPALWFCFLVTLLLLWIAGEKQFLLSPQGAFWIIAQVSVVQFFNPEALRGFGVGVVNGSLWTIPVEIQFYIALPLLLAFGMRFKRFVRPWLWLLMVGIVSYCIWLAIPGLAAGDLLMSKIIKVSLLPHLFQFLLGFALVPLLVIWGQMVTVRILLVMSVVLIFVVTSSGASSLWLRPLLWACLPIGIGLIPCQFIRIPDLSYGLYLFHMPVINFLVFLGILGSQSLVPCLTAVVIFSFISWHCVERPALSLKSVFQAVSPTA